MYKYNCNECTTKCDGTSKKIYNFKSDVELSEYYEKELIAKITNAGYYAVKTTKNQYPDIEIYDEHNGKMKCFIEVKVQRRSFMSVSKILPQSNLVPSETLALNLSDLQHYISQKKEHYIPVYILWVLLERPCIIKDKKVLAYYNDLDELEKILNKYGDKRRFRRKSGSGDVVNGEHKGVVVNYHFSISELKPFSLTNILSEYCKI